MKQLQLKGFVTPEDCGGDLQKALDLAAQLDIRKVVIEQDCTAGTVIVPEGMYIVLKDCTLTANLKTDEQENYSFCKKWITIEGENGTLQGDVRLFNTAHITVTGIALKGTLSLEYTNWARLEGLTVCQGGVKIGRGCVNIIAQNITASVPVCVSGDHSCGKRVPGSKPDVTNVIIQDCKADVLLTAAEDCGLLNIQADHIDGSVTVGEQDKQLPEGQFMNLTFTDLTGSLTLCNPVKHIYHK